MYSEYNFQSDPEEGQLSTKVKIDRIGLREKLYEKCYGKI